MTLKMLVCYGDASSDVHAPTNTERAIAVRLTRDEFLGALMLSGTNKECFTALKTELSNQYGFGNDLYPKSVDQCLTMLNRRADSKICPPQAAILAQDVPKQEEEALVFTQGPAQHAQSKPSPNMVSPKSSSSSSVSLGSKSRHTKGYTSVQCKLCGQMSHISTGCPNIKPPLHRFM